ncbi:MAG: homoserine kinase [Deltaproteobacteria bacterium]|nr:homoserine kinase [Deltaproteobacteria bacterium]
MTGARVFAPATVGNVGPGFDVLGLCVDGAGDTVTVELVDGPDHVTVEGRDAAAIPTDPARNAAVIAARAVLRHAGASKNVRVHLHKGLPVSGGMGGSAASSVGGALAAARALGLSASPRDLMAWALEGEAAVAGRHLDNIAPCVLGGLVLIRPVSPPDVIPVPVPRPPWVALVSPAVRVETRAARAILPPQTDRAEWLLQMANTAALVLAFATGDHALLSRALSDVFAEPRRAPLIPHFHDVKAAALAAGALGCSISGAGPTVFALAADEATARRCATGMQAAFGAVPSTIHVGPVSREGARPA